MTPRSGKRRCLVSSDEEDTSEGEDIKNEVEKAICFVFKDERDGVGVDELFAFIRHDPGVDPCVAASGEEALTVALLALEEENKISKSIANRTRVSRCFSG